MKNGKSTFLVTLLLVFIIVLIIIGFTYACSIVDYTYEYSLHCSLPPNLSLRDTMIYFENNNINYQLVDDKLTVDNTKLVYYLNGETLVPCREIEMFVKLNFISSTELTEKIIKKDGEYTKAYTLKENWYTYCKSDNQYYTYLSCLPLTALIFYINYILIFLILVLM